MTSAFITTVPGIYNPITNNGDAVDRHRGHDGDAGIQGDDIVNNGTITTTGAGSVAININTYGVVTNTGTVAVSGAGSTGVLMSGSFSSLLNYGTINAPPGTFAIQTDSTAVGSLVFNTGVINGAVSIAAGSSARFENSGWMGISAAGAGVTHADQRHLRPDLEGHAVAARGTERRRRPARGQRRGAACRHHADGVPAGHRLQQEL